MTVLPDRTFNIKSDIDVLWSLFERLAALEEQAKTIDNRTHSCPAVLVRLDKTALMTDRQEQQFPWIYQALNETSKRLDKLEKADDKDFLMQTGRHAKPDPRSREGLIREAHATATIERRGELSWVKCRCGRELAGFIDYSLQRLVEEHESHVQHELAK